MEYSSELKRKHQMSVILYVAFMASLALYVLVIQIFKARFKEFSGISENIDFSWLRYVFFALGLAQIFLIRFVRETLTKALASVDPEILTHHLQKMSVLTAALCEVPAIFGLVLFFLSGLIKDFYVLCAISCVLFALFFPRLANWEAWMASKTSH